MTGVVPSFSPVLASNGPVTAPASVARRRARMPATFAAFDVLYLDGETVTRRPYVERRAPLEGLGLTGTAWCTVLSVVGDGPELMAACGQLGLEGLVAKRLLCGGGSCRCGMCAGSLP
jgi:bifunctional non-homologous end joining protein LigD